MPKILTREPVYDAIANVGHLSLYWREGHDKPVIGSRNVRPSMLRDIENHPDFHTIKFKDEFGVKWLWITFSKSVTPIPSWAKTLNWD